MTNAAKYTAPLGEIRIGTRAEGRHAIVEVADNGAGISPQLLPNVFDLFTQGEQTIDRSQGGLGIGLAIVKRLVQMHGGEVTARSEGEGRGSVFEMHIPRIAHQEGASASAAQSQATRHRVLVVDDNQDAANSIAMLLALLGHDAVVAFDGGAALERIGTFRPDLVLLDIGLPGMDGYEVATRIREMPELDQVRIVALSGYGQPDDRRRTGEVGFNDHLVKPVSIEVLERMLSDRS